MDCLFKTLRHTHETPLDSEILDTVVDVSYSADVFSEEDRDRLYRSLTTNLPLSRKCDLFPALSFSFLPDTFQFPSSLLRALGCSGFCF